MIPSVAAIMTRRDITTPATIPPTVLPFSLVSSAKRREVDSGGSDKYDKCGSVALYNILTHMKVL